MSFISENEYYVCSDTDDYTNSILILKIKPIYIYCQPIVANSNASSPAWIVVKLNREWSDEKMQEQTFAFQVQKTRYVNPTN